MSSNDAANSKTTRAIAARSLIGRSSVPSQADKPTLFLGGPITHLKQHRRMYNHCRRLFEHVVEQLTRDAHVKCAHIHEDFGRLAFSPAEIAERDFRWMDDAHVLVFVLPDFPNMPSPLRTDGTFIELGYAVAQRKPTAVFVPDASRHSLLTQGLLQTMEWEISACISPEHIVEVGRRLLAELKRGQR
jgi:nucleoside 2-deoxyribosyltransferase